MNAPVLQLILAVASVAVVTGRDSNTINETRWHLGREGEAEWEEFSVTPPDFVRLVLPFDATVNQTESTLFIQQDDVRHDWAVELNGKGIGKLFLMEADLVSTFAVPGGLLKDDINFLSILPPKAIDDIWIGEVRLVASPVEKVLQDVSLDVQVVDADDGSPLPARITITDERGSLAAMSAGNDDAGRPIAVRPGVAYIGQNGGTIGLPAGEYTILASRGFEYGTAAKKLSIPSGGSVSLELAIRREVPTPGWVSSDTHVHTFTHSRHGDATTDERMLTLAGENIEMPVATDHNFHADFEKPAKRLGVNEFFTPVAGNEVTTRTAHFNAFPIARGSEIPDFRNPSWPALIDHIRERTGASVVVLNHPRNVHNNFQPFATTNFNNVTGENLRGADFNFNAIELLNSSAQQSDFMSVYQGWFALLNHGYRITGVGSSDGHDVSRYIVGQGRTYIQTGDKHPGAIDVDDACRNLIAGRALVSMGLLVDLTVDGKFGVGDLAVELPETYEVSARVFGPSWVSATNVVLFANGVPIRRSTLSGNEGRPGLKATVNWKLDRPPHDVHLVAIVTGPSVTEPFWAIPRPYQQTSKRWIGRVIGSTNPVWADGDGDEKFSAARAIAQGVLDRTGNEPSKLLPALSEFDESVAAQAASLCAAVGVDLESAQWHQALNAATPPVRNGFQRYQKSLP